MEIVPLRGAAAAPHLPAVAALRIAVFREFPYLYDGDLAYEERYLASYVACPDSVVVLAVDVGAVVGASTGLPLRDAEPAWQAPFADDPRRDVTFYFGESVLLPGWRGRGIGHRFFDARESFARARGMRRAVFSAVVRPPAAAPAGYRPHDAFWTKRGYTREMGRETTYAWRDLADAVETPKVMAFWGRDLDG